jgi:ATP-dependent DNA helicase RecG
VPEDSLREAIFNAIIHKDYRGAPIQLSVYNDKLILWNEGRLPEDFTIETLLGKHPSRPYNKNIADVFFKAGFIEAWGRGIAKIINGFTKNNLPAPVFQATMGGILVTVKRGAPMINESKEHVNVTEDVTEDVTVNRLESVLSLIRNDNAITTTKLAQLLNVTRRTIARDVENLKDAGKIRRIGSDKSGFWQIVQ